MTSNYMRVIALTGATGFVGKATISKLRRRFPDAELRLLVRDPTLRTLPDGFDDCTIVAGSLENPETLERLVDRSDCVIHIAGAIAGNSAADFERDNISGTRRLAEAIGATKAATSADNHLIHVSSLAARQPELSWYAASKRAAEEVVSSRMRQFSRQFSILRPPAVYGPQDPALAAFWRMLARGWLVRPGPAGARFSLLHVDDLAEAICRLIDHGPASGIVPLAGPQPTQGWSWTELAQTAEGVAGRRIRTVPVPAPALRLAAGTGLMISRMTGRRAMLTPGKARELMHRDWVCDNLALEQCLGWKPGTRLERALGTLPGWSDK